MSLFLSLAFLFFLGSVSGWGLEVLYRRFLSRANPLRRWINPGFCTGPWLPLYGSGLCVMYLLSGLDRYSVTGHRVPDTALLLAVMMVCMTALEYLAGLLCLRVGRVRLWDYSDRRGNIQGLICPVFSLAWGVLGAVYYFGVNPFIRDALPRLTENAAFSFFIGLFYGVFLVDLGHSAHITALMRSFAAEHQIVVRFEDAKMQLRAFRERAGLRAHFFFAFHADRPLRELMKMAWEERHPPEDDGVRR